MLSMMGTGGADVVQAPRCDPGLKKRVSKLPPFFYCVAVLPPQRSMFALLFKT
jgi:hypothetical protein